MKLDIIVPTHNSSSALLSCVSSLLGNPSLQAINHQIIVSDDGSAPAHIQSLETNLPPQAFLVRSDSNTGAAGTRNRGVNAGNGDFILLIDDDCKLDPRSNIDAMVKMGLSGFELVFGALRAPGSDFFATYFNKVQIRRTRQYENSIFCGGTTALAMISRPMFDHIGGFDGEFRNYGFEDRDFIQRALDQGTKAGYCPKVIAEHEMQPSIKLITDKMYRAGRHTSAIFAHRHPAAYSKSTYAQIDPRLNNWATLLAKAYGSRTYTSVLSILEWCVNLRLAPRGSLRLLTRCMQAIAYAAGCKEADSPLPSASVSK